MGRHQRSAPGSGSATAAPAPEHVLQSENRRGETRAFGMENLCKRYLQKPREIKYTTFMSRKRLHYSACLKSQSVFKVAIYRRLDCALKIIITYEFD